MVVPHLPTRLAICIMFVYISVYLYLCMLGRCVASGFVDQSNSSHHWLVVALILVFSVVIITLLDLYLLFGVNFGLSTRLFYYMIQ